MVKWLLVWLVCVCISNLLCINFASVNYCDPFESIVDFITLWRTINKPPKLMLCKEKIIKSVYVKSTWVEMPMFWMIEILKSNQIQIIWRIFISIKIKLMKCAWKRIEMRTNSHLLNNANTIKHCLFGCVDKTFLAFDMLVMEKYEFNRNRNEFSLNSALIVS